jgi:hypothetical protein
MSKNIFNDISKIYIEEIIKPQLGKPKSIPTSSDKKPGEPGESSEKKIRQAVYDIRYRARREEIPIQQAYNQYMSHTTMTGPEKSAVKVKLLGENKVIQEEEKKYKVRVTDKNSGKSYVRYATREKINQLRSNPNISSVEMTGYGDPYEGERTRGSATAAVKAGKDWDGDGNKESPAKEYRGVVHNAIQKRRGGTPDGKDTSNVKESVYTYKNINENSNLSKKSKNTIKDENEEDYESEKIVKNKIIINPDLKLENIIRNIGGELVENYEIDGVLDELNDDELIILSDNLIENIVEEFFIESLNEGSDVDEIEKILTESLNSSLEVILEANQYFSSMHKAQNKKRQSERRAQKIQKVKDAVKKVGEKIRTSLGNAKEKSKKIASSGKDAIKSGVKHTATAIGTVAGKAAVSAKKFGSAVKSAYDSEISNSDDNENDRIRYKSAKKVKKSPTLISRVGSALKRGLKKVAGKTARYISKGSDKIATKLGEEIINEKSVSKNQQQLFGLALSVKRGKTSRSKVSSEVLKIVDTMSEKEIRKYASTSHLGIPEKVDESIVDQPTPNDDSIRSSQSDTVRKQQLQNLKMIQQKKRQLENQKLQMQKSGRLPLEASYNLDGDLMYEETPVERLDRINRERVAQRAKKAENARSASQQSAVKFKSFRDKHIAGGGTPVSALDAWQKKKTETNESLEIIDERTRERKGQPRSPRNRAMEIMRSMPNARQGLMTRSGKTVAQHEGERGVKKTPGAPTPKGQTTADRLSKRKTQQAVAAKTAQDMYKPREGESD